MNGFYQCPPCCPYLQMLQQQGMCQHCQPGSSSMYSMPGYMQSMSGLQMRQQATQLTPPTCQGFYYTVVPGDTMYRISRRFNVSLDALVAANPWITDPARIYPGMRICIPGEEPETPEPPAPPTEPVACTGGYVYTVVAGDVLSAIARRYNLTTQDLIRANPQLTNPNQLFIGQQICIPLPIPELLACDGTIYVVKTGETLVTIAQRNSLTLETLLAANPQITNPNLIFTGQEICIPEQE